MFTGVLHIKRYLLKQIQSLPVGWHPSNWNSMATRAGAWLLSIVWCLYSADLWSNFSVCLALNTNTHYPGQSGGTVPIRYTIKKKGSFKTVLYLKNERFFFMLKILGYEPSHLGWGGTSPARDMTGKINLCFCSKKFAVTCCLDLHMRFFSVFTNDLGHFLDWLQAAKLHPFNWWNGLGFIPNSDSMNNVLCVKVD